MYVSSTPDDFSSSSAMEVRLGRGVERLMSNSLFCIICEFCEKWDEGRCGMEHVRKDREKTASVRRQ